MWRYGTSIFWHVRWWGLVRGLGIFGMMGAVALGQMGLAAGILGLLCIPSVYVLIWPWVVARATGYRAIWWTPAPPRWLARQLPDPVDLGPVCWEVHAQDARRWRAETPRAAARAYRSTYATEVCRLIAARPDTVALLSSGFNRLTPAEQEAVLAAGGRIWDGPLWPRLLRRYPPWIMVLTQHRMFGGVVSHKDRRDPATWVTWVVPARQAGRGN